MISGINSTLDEMSRKLLDELQKDARLPFAELGRRVGLSPSATAERVRRLEDEGIIRGYRVDIDPRALGYRIMVFTRMRFKVRDINTFWPTSTALTQFASVTTLREATRSL